MDVARNVLNSVDVDVAGNLSGDLPNLSDIANLVEVKVLNASVGASDRADESSESPPGLVEHAIDAFPESPAQHNEFGVCQLVQVDCLGFDELHQHLGFIILRQVLQVQLDRCRLFG